MALGPLTDQVFDAVIFDMDGTLVDSTAAVGRSWSAWAVEFGFGADFAPPHGVPSGAIVATLLPEHLHGTAARRIEEIEVGDVAGILLLPGAAEALRGVGPERSAIATSCTRDLAVARIGASGLAVPRVLVTASDVVRGKPHPDPFLLAAERLGVDPTRCLVVEDAPKGLEAAQAAGCATLAVTTTTPAEELHADAVVSDLAAVTFQAGPRGVTVRER